MPICSCIMPWCYANCFLYYYRWLLHTVCVAVFQILYLFFQFKLLLLIYQVLFPQNLLNPLTQNSAILLVLVFKTMRLLSWRNFKRYNKLHCAIVSSVFCVWCYTWYCSFFSLIPKDFAFVGTICLANVDSHDTKFLSENRKV